jgi:dihydroorotate dehydrogenase
MGGLSGKPLEKMSTNIIRRIRKELPKIPIIGVGGISDVDSAWEKLDAGADLIQLYTGFVYEGPGVIKRIKKGLVNKI